MKVDVSSIGKKFENFVQAGCWDLGLHRSRNVHCRKPIILPNLVLFFGTFLELPVLPSITCEFHKKLSFTDKNFNDVNLSVFISYENYMLHHFSSIIEFKYFP